MSHPAESWHRYHSRVKYDINQQIIGKENIQYDENGKVVEINFMSGQTKEFWDIIFDQLEAYGMTRAEMISYAADKALIYKNIIERYFNGTKEMRVSHHFHLLSKMGFNTKGEMIRPIFTSSVQLNRIILTRRITPEFSLNINPDDWNDLHFDIRGKMRGMSVARFIRMCMLLTNWYFTEGNKGEDKKRRTKNPFTRYKMQLMVKRALLNGDINIGRIGREMSRIQPKKKDE